jgi:host factor-I protein
MGNSADADRNTDDQVATTMSDSRVEKESVGQPQFLPKLLKRPIMIRMMDGRPIKGVVEACNNYELLLDLGQGLGNMS